MAWRGRTAGRKLLEAGLSIPTGLSVPRPGQPGKQLDAWVPPRALLRWEARSVVVGRCRREGKENYYRRRSSVTLLFLFRAGGAGQVSRQTWEG